MRHYEDVQADQTVTHVFKHTSLYFMQHTFDRKSITVYGSPQKHVFKKRN